MHLSPLGSQLSFNANITRIESVTDWEAIARKYRVLMGEIEERVGSSASDDDKTSNENENTNNNNNVSHEN